MNLKEIESILLQDMESVKGGSGAPTCVCLSGAHQGLEPEGRCVCDQGAAQIKDDDDDDDDDTDACEDGFITTAD